MFFLPLIQAGLTVASGLAAYSLRKKEAKQDVAREYERQAVAINEYLEEQKARQTEYKLQLQQLRNVSIESKEAAESQKGDIAMAAEAAKSRVIASQSASGLAVGQGTFGNVLREVGFAQANEAGKVETTMRNRLVNVKEEEGAAYERSKVPAPYLSKITAFNSSGLALGTGLSIASSLAGIYDKHGSLGASKSPSTTRQTKGKKAELMIG